MRLLAISATIVLCAFAWQAEASCYACSFVGTDVACVKKANGYTNCGTTADKTGQKCETEGSPCGAGGGLEPEDPMAFNDGGSCTTQRLVLVAAEAGPAAARPRLQLASVTLPRGGAAR